jgi:glycosyltransferase involved in cell wall biosynthesis
LKTILINGYFLCRRFTGIERYAYEITSRLDKLCKPDEIAMIVPIDADNIPKYKNIRIIRYGKTIQNILWQMFTLQWFLITHKKYTILEFGNTALPLAPGIVFLHDIYCEFFPEDFVSKKDKFTRLYNRIQYRFIAYLAKKIVTVSEFSKKEISETFNINPAKIDVIYSSADHIRNIEPDFSIFEQFPALKEKQFFFSLGSLSKRKNIKWIIEYAKKHPESTFVISGTSLSTVKVNELGDEIPLNIIMLGYIDDSKVKALMTKCQAFVLPSYYEGFGLTPLEALLCGAQIIIAKAASLPEIYGKTAHYIDPYDIDMDLDILLNDPVEKPDEIIAKYSYDISAKKVYNIIKDFTL